MKITLITIAITSLMALLAFKFSNASAKVIFDIPSFKGKNIHQIKKLLGKATSESIPDAAQYKLGIMADAYFDKDGYTLDVQYNPINQKVIDYFLSHGGTVNDYHLLEQAGNLTKATGVIIKPVKALKDPTQYTGIIITAK